MIARCCGLKAEVVRCDEREESGRRAVLNYGHTFAHALETLTGYSGSGTARRWRSAWTARSFGRAPGRIERATVERQRALLETFGLSVRLPKLDREKIVAAMLRDKKAEHGRLRLVLPSRIGHAEVVEDVSVADLRVALEP